MAQMRLLDLAIYGAGALAIGYVAYHFLRPAAAQGGSAIGPTGYTEMATGPSSYQTTVYESNWADFRVSNADHHSSPRP